MKTIITVLDRITETSMPFNEFVVYRSRNFKNEKNILIVFGKKKKMPKIEIPNNLKIYYANNRIKTLRTIIKKAVHDETDKDGFVIHIHQVKSGFATQMALLFTKLRRNTLFTVHSTFPGYSLHNKLLSIATAALSNYVTCVGDTSYEKYPKIIKMAKKDRIIAIRNGVDTKRIDLELQNKEKHNNKTINFIYVARIIPIKNHEFIINVIKKSNPNATFTLIGDDNSSYAKRIKNLCEQDKIANRVLFTGTIPRTEVYNYLRQSNVYISPSTLEGMPISILEAAYTGLPLIISDIPQHKELAGDESCISVLPFDIDIWVNEINRYMSMPNSQIEKIGMTCRKYVAKNFSLDKMHEEYSSLYKKMGAN